MRATTIVSADHSLDAFRPSASGCITCLILLFPFRMCLGRALACPLDERESADIELKCPWFVLFVRMLVQKKGQEMVESLETFSCCLIDSCLHFEPFYQDSSVKLSFNFI